MKLNVDVYLYLPRSASFPIYKKIKKLKFRKDLFGRLWVLAGSLWSFVGGLRSFAAGLRLFTGSLWSFAGSLKSFAGDLLRSFVVICGRFWSLAVLVPTNLETLLNLA